MLVDEYRFGFQGQETDGELYGEGNAVNFKYRMHDPRVGRFFAVDPLTAKYPHYTPYSFSGNKVIHKVELEGLEEADPSYLERSTNIRSLIWALPERESTVLRIGRSTNMRLQENTITQNSIRFTLLANDKGIGIFNTEEHVGHGGGDDGRPGSEANAFRHVLWQAQIANEFGEEIAKGAGDAHEQGLIFDLENATETSYANLELADEAIDQLNNQIGRDIGMKMKGRTNMRRMARKVLRHYHTEGFYKAEYHADSKSFTVVKNKISRTQYAEGINSIKTKNDKGMSKTTSP